METSCKPLIKCGFCESTYTYKASLKRHMRIKHKLTTRNQKNLIPKVDTNIVPPECNFKLDKVDGEERDSIKTCLTTSDVQLNEIKATRDKICEIAFRFHVDVDCAVVNILQGLESHISNVSRKIL
tara:strand:+ start:744 stop:1121 length:378 start_codon:yes stop_codon:yes gene_type:complete